MISGGEADTVLKHQKLFAAISREGPSPYQEEEKSAKNRECCRIKNCNAPVFPDFYVIAAVAAVAAAVAKNKKGQINRSGICLPQIPLRLCQTAQCEAAMLSAA